MPASDGPSALQSQRAQTGLDQHRRARVTERVETDAGQAGTLGGGNEHASAQAALIGRAAVTTGEHERVATALRGRWKRSLAASSGVSGISRAPWRDFGATIAPLTTARRTCRCGVSPWRARSLQRSPISSEIRNPGRGKQFEHRPPLRRHLVEQPYQLCPRQKAPLAHRPCATGTPARQHDLLGRVGVQ